MFAAFSASAGNGVERGSVNFADQAKAISANVQSAVIDAIQTHCRITRKVKDFSLISMQKDPSDPAANWTNGDVFYKMKFKVIYADTWHRDWIEMVILEPYDWLSGAKTSYLKASLKSLYSVTGACETL